MQKRYSVAATFLFFLTALLALSACSAPPPESQTQAPPATSTNKSSYKLLEGTPLENEVVVLSGEGEGPVIYIVAGIHGDEIAGPAAAEQLKNTRLKSGTLYILSPANLPGAENNERWCYEGEDLNRLFPGLQSGSNSQQTAYSIYSDIEKRAPALVLDLHEALVQRQNRDFLGNSLIYTSLDGIELLFLELLEQTANGSICSVPFNFYSPGVPGSINNTVANGLKIPIITTETFRGDDFDARVQNQLDLVYYVLNYYGMV